MAALLVVGVLLEADSADAVLESVDGVAESTAAVLDPATSISGSATTLAFADAVLCSTDAGLSPPTGVGPDLIKATVEAVVSSEDGGLGPVNADVNGDGSAETMLDSVNAAAVAARSLT